MSKAFESMEYVIQQRREQPMEKSYTCYLFEKGMDKILKKVGEETAETIIAAKNGDHENLVGEINDLLYHLMVMMNEAGVTLAEVEEEMDKRAAKIGARLIRKGIFQHAGKAPVFHGKPAADKAAVYTDRPVFKSHRPASSDIRALPRGAVADERHVLMELQDGRRHPWRYRAEERLAQHFRLVRAGD